MLTIHIGNSLEEVGQGVSVLARYIKSLQIWFKSLFGKSFKKPWQLTLPCSSKLQLFLWHYHDERNCPCHIPDVSLNSLQLTDFSAGSAV
jgi:hypothetical protein